MRRANPRVRCVAPAAPPPPRVLLPVDANLWALGLDTLQRLARFYPNAYARHVAGMGITPRSLYVLGEVFLGLVHQEVLLQETWCWQLPAEPLAYLPRALALPAPTITDLDDLFQPLHNPYPQAYGLGVHAYFDDGLYEPSLLTLALWWLMQGTSWDVGIDMQQLLNFDLQVPVEQRRLVARLNPLSYAAPMDALANALTATAIGLRGWQPLCLNYAFARTGNVLADVSSGEVEFQDYVDIGWSDLPELRTLVKPAQQLQRIYDRWEAKIERDPRRELPKLADALHRAARSFLITQVEHTQPIPLADMEALFQL